MAVESKAIGRPSLFNQGMIDRAKEYVAFFQLPEEERLNLRDTKINPVEEIPSAAGLALYLGVSKKTIYNWGDKNKEFLHTLEALQDTQEVLLLNNGLTGKFTSPISKLALANHGYSDKQEVAMTVNPLDEILDEIEHDARRTKEETEE